MKQVPNFNVNHVQRDENLLNGVQAHMLVNGTATEQSLVHTGVVDSNGTVVLD